jgi:hypothetical protein
MASATGSLTSRSVTPEMSEADRDRSASRVADMAFDEAHSCAPG